MRFTRLKVFAAAMGSLLTIASLQANLAFSFAPDAGTPQYVVDGFTLAASRWSAVLADNITINLGIGFQSLPAGVIGETTSAYLQEPYTDVLAALTAGRTSADDYTAVAHLPSGPNYSRLINHTADNPNGANSSTPYVHSLTPVAMTRANGKALGFLSPSPEVDAAIRFSSKVGFDFDPSDGTTSGQYDFATLAAHEIGHVLGFESTVDQLEQLHGSGVADQLPSTVLDLFRYSSASLAAGPGYTDCAADSRAKYFSVDGGQTKIAGFATGAVYGGGYQASHWQEFTWVGLMDPTVFQGMQRQLSRTDLWAFDAIGYTLVPEPGTCGLLALGLLALRAATMRERLSGLSPITACGPLADARGSAARETA